MACNIHEANRVVVNEKKTLKNILLGVFSSDFHTVIDMDEKLYPTQQSSQTWLLSGMLL